MEEASAEKEAKSIRNNFFDNGIENEEENNEVILYQTGEEKERLLKKFQSNYQEEQVITENFETTSRTISPKVNEKLQVDSLENEDERPDTVVPLVIKSKGRNSDSPLGSEGGELSDEKRKGNE
jgi:hypothetical protein